MTGLFDVPPDANGDQLDEALAGLARIAKAAGIWEKTWQARSIPELCDMLAAWAAARTPPGTPTGTVTEYRAAGRIDAGQVVEQPRAGLVRPLARGGRPAGTAVTSAVAGEPVYVRRPEAARG
jgi:hypothetical protein